MKTRKGTRWLTLGVVFVLLLQSLMVSVFAVEEEDLFNEIETATAEQSEISISFRLGSDTLTINGNQVTVETPVEINGTTLVPLRVISEAFGAQVEWNGADESVTLTYSDTVIQVWIGKKECLVGTEQATLLEAPILQNDSTMVPLRFISENFGADVDYDGATEQITVVKKVANDNSVKDFAMILKKSTKEYVGDSYYGWSMKMPKKYALEYRSFNGDETVFQTSDETETILVEFLPMSEEDTLESRTNQFTDSFSKFVLQDRESITVDGMKMNRLTYKADGEILVAQLGVKNDWFVMLCYTNADATQYNAQKQESLSLLNSFHLDYTQDSAVEDLSDVGENGLREYQNKEYGLRFGVFPDWYDVSEKENVMEFANLAGKKADPIKLFHIEVTTAESGMTVEEWIAKMRARDDKMYNPKYVTVTQGEDVTNQSGTWKTLTYEIEEANYVSKEKQFYQIRDGYKYLIAYGMLLDEGKLSSLPVDEIDQMFASLQLEGVDADVVGKILDENMLEEELTYRTVTGSDKWSVEIPDDWEKIPSTSVEIYGTSDGTSNSIGVSAEKENISYTQLVRNYDQYVKDMVQDLGYTKLSMTNSKLGGVACRKYTMLQDVGGHTVHYEMYVTIHNGKIYVLSAAIRDLYASEYNLGILHKVVESFKFTD